MTAGKIASEGKERQAREKEDGPTRLVPAWPAPMSPKLDWSESRMMSTRLRSVRGGGGGVEGEAEGS